MSFGKFSIAEATSSKFLNIRWTGSRLLSKMFSIEFEGFGLDSEKYEGGRLIPIFIRKRVVFF